MAVPQTLVYGIVKNGIVLPEATATLPEGARVEIIVSPLQVPADLQAEFAAWQASGDESWAMIDDWEKEETS